MSGPIRVGCLALASLAIMTVLPLAGALLSTASTLPSAAASTLDVPADVLDAIESAARASGVPWPLLAAIASVATDFGRHGPDGLARGVGTDAVIFPVVSPPITGAPSGDGMFLLDPAGGSIDLQDVAASAGLLGDLIAARAAAGAWPATVGLPQGDLSVPTIAAFWRGVVVALPLRIAYPASTAIQSASGAGGATGAGASGEGVGAGGMVGGSANPIEQFARALLVALGDPVTPGAIGSIAAWAAGEGSCARANPLDTTQPEPGATPFNTLAGGGHVWNYPSWPIGVQATVETLRNGLYPTILAVLAGHPTPTSLEAAVRASPWGTGRFGNPDYRGAHCPNSFPAPDPGALVTTTDPSAIADLIVSRAAGYQAALITPTPPAVGGAPSALAISDIPSDWLNAIRTVADRDGVAWTLLAAILKETCDFGRSQLPGCQPGGATLDGGRQGYALFTGTTWRRGLPADRPIPRDGRTAAPGGGYATDGDGDGVADPWSVADATASCARQLVDLGADEPGQVGPIAFAYLHGPSVAFDPADQLTAQVLAWFASYGGAVEASDGFTLPVDRTWYDQHRDWFQRPHHDYPAVDIPVPAGTAVYAVTSSTVIAADEDGGATDCGHDVRLRDSAGVVYTYCHGSEVLVSAGERVTAGQLILRSGWSGHVAPAGPAGAHLHFQINLPGSSSSSCPQPALAAWASGNGIDLRTLPSAGCVSAGAP